MKMEENYSNNSNSNGDVPVQRAIRNAEEAIGRGFDVNYDTRLLYCTANRLVEIDGSAPDVSCSYDEPGRRDSTGACSFHEMAEIFNRNAELSGTIPLGSFNAAFGLTGSRKTDSRSTKCLAVEGKLIPLCKVRLVKSNFSLKDDVVGAIPSSWDPLGLSRFIESYGTHIVTSVTIGGKDVIYVKQHANSSLSSEEIKNYIQDIANNRFSDEERSGPIRIKEKDSGSNSFNSQGIYPHPPNPHISAKEDVTVIFRRRGGDDLVQSHNAWARTVNDSPDVIEMTFLPLASLLEGLPGKEHLVRAINLYLEYKPPIEELRYFLEFQVKRVWAPIREENPLRQRKEPVCPSLQFSIMGKKLYISQEQVSVGRKPVTGLKLSLSGPKLNLLSIHLEHLLSLPKILRSYWDSHVPIGPPKWVGPEEQDSRWFEPVKWRNFSHVSTAPVEYHETLITEGIHVVTGAQLGVWDFGTRNVLFMKLLFSKVPGCTVRRSLWEVREGEEEREEEGGEMGYKLGKFVEVRERSRGPEDSPGHWVVTGGKLGVERGKICLRVKYSLLNY
ncbi:hypothetical protein LUZ60_015433 [Juncus effusus]|nr:hypothetical protein LUZ60_015433 [Juncus effusus]